MTCAPEGPEKSSGYHPTRWVKKSAYFLTVPAGNGIHITDQPSALNVDDLTRHR